LPGVRIEDVVSHVWDTGGSTVVSMALSSVTSRIPCHLGDVNGGAGRVSKNFRVSCMGR
jgi:hypothetical protein